MEFNNIGNHKMSNKISLSSDHKMGAKSLELILKKCIKFSKLDALNSLKNNLVIKQNIHNLKM